ncbi:MULTISPECIES: hypothetical protein [unclassified Mesorhizobium]|uniref:hypothetical protein n=1 Tax=unclassified Mesorhizobium TaxID=325217 RepID=UPI001FEE1215|nr:MULTISPECIES: hypothetical protein [unclassified Mesorhizobium]
MAFYSTPSRSGTAVAWRPMTSTHVVARNVIRRSPARCVGTTSWTGRFERMIRRFAYALIFVQVSMATALATQVFLSTTEQALKSERWLALAPSEDEGCAKAMWPNIPERCLQRVEPKVVTLVLSQNN